MCEYFPLNNSLYSAVHSGDCRAWGIQSPGGASEADTKNVRRRGTGRVFQALGWMSLGYSSYIH